MAYIKQISAILNDVISESLGKANNITTKNTTDVVSLGKKISEYDLYEDFYKSLVNRIVKTVYMIRGYRGKERSILRDEHEYGAFVQRVYYELPEAVDDKSFDMVQANGTYIQSSPYDVTATVKVSSMIFGGQGAWSIEIIRPIAQIKTAFLSDTEMLNFINGIYMSVENRYQLDVENLCNLAVNTSIANTLQSGYSVNLLESYNTAVSPATPLKAADALKNADFLRFAAREISKTITFLQEMSTIFNVKGYTTFTPKENMVVEMLADFTSAYTTNLESNTFHNELISLPGYEEVSFWQGSGKYFSFDQCSAIDITNEDLATESNTTGAVKQKGIVCFIHDIENVAAYFGERETWEMYNPRNRVMIHGEHARKGFAVDSNMNSCVFYIADSAS